MPTSLAGSVHRYYNNTVFLNQIPVSGNPKTASCYASTISTLDMRNNILVNTSPTLGTGATISFWRSSISGTTYSAYSNYNCFHAGTPGPNNLLFYAFDAVSPQSAQNLTGYQSIFPQEAQSFSEVPPFLNSTIKPYNLHLDSTNSTSCESGAGTINIPPISTDYDAQPRYPNPGYPDNTNPLFSSVAPDVGADEFGGIPSFNCVMPVPGNTLASANNLCYGEGTTLSLQYPPTGTGVTFQWQSSPDGLIFTNISGANDVNCYVVPNTSLYYRCSVTCHDGPVSATSAPLQLTFLNNVTGITPGTRCGTGTVTLEATGNPGTTVNWYSVPSGGYPIYTGNTFTTPVISATATYYAGTSGPTTSNSVGAPAIFVSYSFDTQTSTAEGINFNVLAGTVTIHTIDIYPTAPVGSPFTISVKQASATIASYSGTITVQGTLSEPAVQTVPVHFVLPSGTGYQITAPVNPGIIRNSGGDAFPYIVPGIISLTSSTLPSYYFNFYNWQITTACISPAFPVVATVLSPPSLSVSLGRTLCSGEVGQIKVTSTIPDFDTYTWSPVNHLYSDSACTIPYLSPVSATTVFFKSSLAGATTYTCSAQKVSSGCSNTAQTEIIVIPSPVITALPAAICVSGITTLGITPATGYGTATFQWQKSGDNILFSDIPGATSPAYTTETLNATQYYKILIMNEEGSICNEPSITISVNNPVIVSTTPGTRCGTGSVNLSATGSPGTSIKWYQGPSGGMSIGTGNSFATPVISASTSFYAAAGIAAGEVGSAGPAGNSMGVGGYAANDYYLLFDVIASSLHLNGLYVYPGASGNVKFYIADNTGTVLHTVTYPVQAGNIGMKTYIPVGFDIPTGMNYRIGYAASIGGVSLFRNTNGAGYPYSRTNIVTITGNSFPGNPQFYYYFYDWQVTAECWSGRTEVVATVTPAPAITVTATPNSVCAGGASNLNVTSSDAGYIYNWMPGNLNGGGQTVYQEVSTVYEVTANDPLTGCYTDGNVLVTVLPSPATLSISPPEPLVFQDSVQELTATGGDIDGFVILSESFDQPANNWIKTNNSTGGQPPNAAWTLRPDGYEYLSYGIWHSNDHSQFYLTNSNAQGSGSTTSTILQSPAFNTIGYSAANVSFDHYFYEPSAGSSTGVFEVSTDGTTWATLQTYSSTTGAVSAFARASIALTAEFLNQPSVYIRLKYDGAWRYFWGIDNIVIRGNAQTNVTWTPITSLYSDVNATLPYNGESTTTVYSKPSSTITYSVLATAVLTGCTRTDAVTVTVIQPCNAPTALTGNNITATAADLGWTETGTATQWNIEYGPSGFRQGTGTLISGVTLNPYHLIGLSESTAYDFHVRANCIQITSQWSVIQSFTTSAAIPLNLTVEGDISGSECYSALNTITVAENGPYNVQAGAQAEMIAGVSIIYKPGTRVWNNGYMLGRIAPNGPWCPVQPPAVMSAVTGVDIPVPGIESKSFAVYPNPTSGNFTLVQKGDHSPLLLKVEIFGMNGKSVLAETISGEKMHQFNLSELADGLYFIKVMGTDCFETIKLVKTRQVTK
jgi:hypothetical protein